MAKKPAMAMKCLLKKNGHPVTARSEQELIAELINRYGGTQEAWRPEVRTAIREGSLVVEMKNGHVVGYRTLMHEQSSVESAETSSSKSPVASLKVSVA